MKLRSDSPFAKLTEDQCDTIVAASSYSSILELLAMVTRPPLSLSCSLGALSRFLRRAKEDKQLRESEASQETVEAFANRGEGRKVREATMSAVRDRMFEAAVDPNIRDQLPEVFAALNDEQSKAKMIEIEERKVMVAEDNVRLGWRKLECENARAGLKVLPRLREVLTDTTKNANDRVALALECLGTAGMPLLAAGPCPEAAQPKAEAVATTQ